MRALCGAIITAASLVGLGLTAIGFGSRYHIPLEGSGADGQTIRILVHEMGWPLVYILVLLTCTTLIGMGIAFFGLAHHHRRRHEELRWEKERFGPQQRIPV